MSKRKTSDVVGFVDQVSPSKKPPFRFVIQTGENTTKRAICFDITKLNDFKKKQDSCEPVKILDVVLQEAVKESHAEIVVNTYSRLKDPTPADINFPRKEVVLDVDTIIDVKEKDVGVLVSVIGKLDVSRSREKNVPSYGRLTENNFISDQTATIPLTMWGDWIDYFGAKIAEENVHFKFYNLQVKHFDPIGKYLTTCSSTFIREVPVNEIQLTVQTPPEAEETLDMVNVSFISVRKFNYYYACFCGKQIKYVPGANFVKCNACGCESKASGLAKNVIVQVLTDHSNSLYNIDYENILLLWDVHSDPFSLNEESLIRQILENDAVNLLLDKETNLLSVVH